MTLALDDAITSIEALVNLKITVQGYINPPTTQRTESFVLKALDDAEYQINNYNESITI